jgi:GTP-binding protein HflX
VTELLTAIDRRLGTADVVLTVRVPAADGRLLAWLHENAEVLSRVADESGDLRVEVRIEDAKQARLAHQLRRAD